MVYDYGNLIGRISEVCGTRAAFAKRMGWSERTVSLKLNNRVPFKQREIQTAVDVLRLSEEDIQLYFFSLEAQQG